MWSTYTPSKIQQHLKGCCLPLRNRNKSISEYSLLPSRPSLSWQFTSWIFTFSARKISRPSLHPNYERTQRMRKSTWTWKYSTKGCIKPKFKQANKRLQEKKERVQWQILEVFSYVGLCSKMMCAFHSLLHKRTYATTDNCCNRTSDCCTGLN